MHPGGSCDAGSVQGAWIAMNAELPHNTEAEQQILGALLLNNDLLDRVSAIIRQDSFYEPVHGDIFAVISRRVEAGTVASPVTIKGEMQNHEGLRVLGGARYIVNLAGASISANAIADYAKIVADLAKRRGLVSIADDLRHGAVSDESNAPAKHIEDAESRLYTLAEGEQQNRGPVSFLKSVMATVEAANEARQRGGGLSGLSTGLVDLDRKLGGLSPSDLLILAGRPSMGKTALATNIAFNVAKAYNRDAGTGGAVAFFSLEMSHDQLTARILSDVASVSAHAVRSGDMTEEQMGSLVQAAKDVSNLPITIDDTPAITIAQLASRARRIKRTTGLDLLVVDYLQLMRGPTSSRGNRVQEISEISMGLKAVAKDLNVPVIALSQLSRQVENREDKRPQLSDLRESGSIEQDADIVMFVYRHEYYVERARPDEGSERFADWMEEYERSRGKAEVILGKHRHGSVGGVDLSFDGNFTRFGNLARDWQHGQDSY